MSRDFTDASRRINMINRCHPMPLIPARSAASARKTATNRPKNTTLPLSTRLSTTTRLLHRSPGNSSAASLNARTRHVCALVARTVPRRVKGALVSNSSETAYVAVTDHRGWLIRAAIFPRETTRRESRSVARPRMKANLMPDRRSTANVRRNASTGCSTRGSGSYSSSGNSRRNSTRTSSDRKPIAVA